MAVSERDRQAVFILHAYNPDRYGSYVDLRGKSTSLDGVNYTLRVSDRSYGPVSQLGLLERVSYTYAPTLARQLEDHRPEVAAEFERNFRTNGVASPAIHSILVHRNIDDKRILIGAGLQKNPSADFWAPEGTYDQETLEVLGEYNIRAFICRPDGIVLDDGGNPENTPVKIPLSNGKSIIAIPFDKHLSHMLGMDPKHNADEFAANHVEPRLNGRPVFAITDFETFGEHMPYRDKFLAHLVHRRLADNVVPLSSVDLSGARSGRLEGITSWSCFHGALRWKDACPCHEGDIRDHGADISWKKPYFEATVYLNDQMTDLVRPVFGKNYVDVMSRDFEKALYNPGAKVNKDEELAVKSAKASGLADVASCPTFFASIYTTGLVNMIMARQAVLHARDAGFVSDARRIEEGFKTRLEGVSVYHPYTAEKISGVQLYEDIIGDQTLIRKPN